MNYAVIGTGWITKELINSAELCNNAKLCAVYSRNEETGKNFAGEFGVSCVYTNLEELAKSEIEAVYIASPNVCHYEQAKLLLMNKKHILCEKSIAASASQVQELIDVAAKQGVVFLEAIKSMYTPGAELLKEACKKIGRISQASFVFEQLSSKYPALLRGELPNIFNPEMQTGAVMDIGVYCLHPAVYLFGKPETVIANAVLSDLGIDLCGDAILRYPDKSVTVSYSKIANQAVPSQIIGDAGMITIEKISTCSGITLHRNDGSREVLYPHCPDEMHMRYEAEFFANAISSPEQYQEKVQRFNEQSVVVCDLLAQIRKLTGVVF